MASTIEITHRGPFHCEGEAHSGAWFERGQLADGRAVVLKHLPPDGDWLTRAANGLGRAQELWTTGLLDRLAATVDHPILDVFHDNDHDVVVMEDVGVHLLPTGRAPTRSEFGAVLEGLAAMHAAWEGSGLEGLCSPGHRHRVLSPTFHDVDDGPNPFPRREGMVGAWGVFAEQAPPDVAEVVAAIHADPGLIERRLQATAPSTFLHGDAKPDNLGSRRVGRLMAVDWGELAGYGPAEMDVTWCAATSTQPSIITGAWRLDVMPDEVFRAYDERAARPLDPAALDAACIGIVAQFGFLWAVLANVPGLASNSARDRATEVLDWWVARARDACERWSPV